MSLFNKIVISFALMVASTSLFATQLMIVQCNMNPVASPTASYSDPKTGKMIQADSCGLALAQVPGDYVLISSASGGMSSAAFVDYLFSTKPVCSRG